MTVKVIKDSVIYKKQIYRCGDDFAVSAKVGNSLIERGYVKKVSDEPAFNDSTVGEEEFDRILLNDTKDGKSYQLFVEDSKLHYEEREN